MRQVGIERIEQLEEKDPQHSRSFVIYGTRDSRWLALADPKSLLLKGLGETVYRRKRPRLPTQLNCLSKPLDRRQILKFSKKTGFDSSGVWSPGAFYESTPVDCTNCMVVGLGR